MLIKDIMTENAVTCSETETLNEAAQRMWERDIGSVPVVNERGVATGMLTDRDICMAGYTQGRTLAEIPVSTAMSSRLLSVWPDADVDAAQRLMRENQIRRLPVVDLEGKPVGMVGLNDMARRFGSGRSEIAAREVAETLKEVCRPREHAEGRPLEATG